MSQVLVVDDDNDFLQACEDILTRDGYEVILANSIVDAETAIKNGGLDLILLDVMMENPDDGISFAHKLKKEGNTVPVIILSGVSKVTGYEFKSDEMLPCVDFIEKPVTPEILLNKVKTAVSE